MKKRVCILMSAIGFLALAQNAGANVKKNILAEPNWVSTSNNQSVSVITTGTSNNISMLANATSSNSPATVTSPDGFASMESHHGGGGGDGIEGHNIFGIGVGFVGGLAGADGLYGSGYTSSVTPGIRIDWERGFTSNIGIGLFFQYAGSTFSSTYTDETITGYDAFGDPIYSTGTYTDKYTLTFITIAARGNYHFLTSGNFDPYVGITLGYVAASESYSTTDPNNTGSGVVGAGSAAAFGGQLGARYFFNDHIGAFFELAFATNYAEDYINLGLSIKL